MRIVTLLAAALTALAGCATQQPISPTSSTEGTTLVRTGQITSLRDVSSAGGQPSGLGSVVGGLLGGIAGSSIGDGYGRAAAAIGGGLAGGYAGHEVEKAGGIRKFTEVGVRFPNGDERTYQIEPDSSLRVGETVKVVSQGGTIRISR